VINDVAQGARQSVQIGRNVSKQIAQDVPKSPGNPAANTIRITDGLSDLSGASDSGTAEDMYFAAGPVAKVPLGLPHAVPLSVTAHGELRIHRRASAWP